MAQENEELAKIYGPVETTRKNPYQKGTRYYDLYEANPYTDEKFTRQETFWDKIASGLGFRSGYDAAKEEWRKAAGEYDAQIAQLKSEDEYNSEAAKAQRMKEAGLNPDLIGTAGVSEAGEFAQEQTSPNINVEPEFRMSNFISELGKTFVTVMGLTKDVANTMGLMQDIQGKKLENANKVNNLVEDYVKNYMPDTITDNETGEPKYNYADSKYIMMKGAEMWAMKNGISKKAIPMFVSQVRDYAETHKGEIFKKWEGNLKAKSEFGKTIETKYVTVEDDTEEVTKIWANLTNELANNIAYGIKKEAKENENKYRYENALDPEQIAAGENAEAKAKAGVAAMQDEAKKAIEEATKALGKAAKEGNWFALILESLLPGMYLKFIGK